MEKASGRGEILREGRGIFGKKEENEREEGNGKKGGEEKLWSWSWSCHGFGGWLWTFEGFGRAILKI